MIELKLGFSRWNHIFRHPKGLQNISYPAIAIEKRSLWDNSGCTKARSALLQMSSRCGVNKPLNS